jgi:hypothetical protein
MTGALFFISGSVAAAKPLLHYHFLLFQGGQSCRPRERSERVETSPCAEGVSTTENEGAPKKVYNEYQPLICMIAVHIIPDGNYFDGNVEFQGKEENKMFSLWGEIPFSVLYLRI